MRWTDIAASFCLVDVGFGLGGFCLFAWLRVDCRLVASFGRPAHAHLAKTSESQQLERDAAAAAALGVWQAVDQYEIGGPWIPPRRSSALQLGSAAPPGATQPPIARSCHSSLPSFFVCALGCEMLGFSWS